MTPYFEMGPPQGGEWQSGQPGQMPPQPMTPEQEQEMRQRMAPQGGEGGVWQPGPGTGMPSQGGMIQGIPPQGTEGGGQAPSTGSGQAPMLQPEPYILEPGMGMGGPTIPGEQAPLAPMFQPTGPGPAPSGSGGGFAPQPAPQPAPMMGPAPSSGGGGGEAPAPPPQGLLAPFKSFLGSIADFLSR